MTAEALIQQATIEARASWERLAEEKLKELYNLFEISSNNIIAQLDKYAIEGKIPPYRLAALNKNIKKEMQILRIAMNGQFRSYINSAINYGISDPILILEKLKAEGLFNGKAMLGTAKLNADGSISKYSRDLSTFANSMWGRINSDALEFLLRYEFGGDMLSARIWRITYETGRAIKQAIHVGVLEGWSSAKLSRSIRGFLNEPNKLYRRVRKGGQLVLSEPAKGYHPGQGMYRSSYKNAMRLARTEINRAYAEGTLRYGATKPWIDGYIWRVGGANPCPICSDENGGFFLKDDATGIPAHPHCMCYWELHIAAEKLIPLKDAA